MEQPSTSFFQIPIYIVGKEAKVVETETAEEETAAVKWAEAQAAIARAKELAQAKEWAQAKKLVETRIAILRAKEPAELTEEQEEQIEELKAATLLIQFAKGRRMLQRNTARQVKRATIPACTRLPRWVPGQIHMENARNAPLTPIMSYENETRSTTTLLRTASTSVHIY
jgi:hypothetical protein